MFVSEVGVPYAYSSQWEWPELAQITRERLGREFVLESIPGVAESAVANHRRHYHNGDTHYYTYPNAGGGSAPMSSALRALIVSDPHIMCTIDK